MKFLKMKKRQNICHNFISQQSWLKSAYQLIDSWKHEFHANANSTANWYTPLVLWQAMDSQKAEKGYSHLGETTGTSSDFTIAPLFEMGTSTKGKNLLPEEVNSFL